MDCNAHLFHLLERFRNGKRSHPLNAQTNIVRDASQESQDDSFSASELRSCRRHIFSFSACLCPCSALAFFPFRSGTYLHPRRIRSDIQYAQMDRCGFLRPFLSPSRSLIPGRLFAFFSTFSSLDSFASHFQSDSSFSSPWFFMLTVDNDGSNSVLRRNIAAKEIKTDEIKQTFRFRGNKN